MTGGKRGGSPKLRPAMTGSVTSEGDRLAPHLPRIPGQETGLGRRSRLQHRRKRYDYDNISRRRLYP